MKVAVIGCGAYLAYHIEDILENAVCYQRLESLSDSKILSTFDYVINFSIQPSFKQRKLNPEELIDAQIANIIKDSNAKFVMISSRKVYGTSNTLVKYSENAELKASDSYSFNKIAAEHMIQQILPGRCLILRVGNVLDLPRVKSNQTFISWITDSLVSNKVLNVTENKSVAKDFITRDYLQYALKTLMDYNAKGIYNVGAGFESTLEDLLPRIAGKQHVVFASEAPIKDQFVLDCSKAHKIIKPFLKQDLYRKCEIINAILMKNMTK